MDDLFSKMQSVMSDPESMKQLKELAELMGNDDKDTSAEQPVQQEESSGDIGFDIGKILELSSVLGSSGNSEDAALLLALKPHLKKERRKKVDKAVKLLKMLELWETLKDSGLLKDIL
ncbi:MAG: hypothetical protein ACI4JN_10515 [Ruminococcus sp.]